jgi:hypothetical protein
MMTLIEVKSPIYCLDELGLEIGTVTMIHEGHAALVAVKGPLQGRCRWTALKFTQCLHCHACYQASAPAARYEYTDLRTASILHCFAYGLYRIMATVPTASIMVQDSIQPQASQSLRP